MSDENTAPSFDAGIRRSTLVRGAVWAAPVLALTVATPLAAASGPARPTDIEVTLAPTPPSPGSPMRLTYRGAVGFDTVPFPAGATATATITGAFAGLIVSGASITSQSGTDPIILTLAITDSTRFYLQGTPQSGTTVAVQVFDAGGTSIGSRITQVSDPV